MTDRFPRRRNRLRYPGYDYAQPGAIFVTLCTYSRQPLFGTVSNGLMVHSLAVEMALTCWYRIPDKYAAIGIDAVVVMPDHVHGILFPGVEPDSEEYRVTVGEAVRWFKTATIRAYREGVMIHAWEPYERHLWQPKYHDRIIRSEAELATVRTYIEANPARWWERHQADLAEPVVYRHRAWESKNA